VYMLFLARRITRDSSHSARVTSRVRLLVFLSKPMLFKKKTRTKIGQVEVYPKGGKKNRGKRCDVVMSHGRGAGLVME